MVCMADFPASLKPAALTALLKKVDEVCAQAQDLRMEIISAMKRRRADDQQVSGTRPTRPRRLIRKKR